MLRSRRRSVKRRYSSDGITDIPLTPLIDTVLTLLLIFMISGPVIDKVVNESHQIKEAEDSALQNPLVVSVNQQGLVKSDDGRVMPVEEFISRLKLSRHGQGRVQKIIIRVDPAIVCGKVLSIIDHLKSAQVADAVALMAEQVAR
jgi:biopolymer transport protein ExbD